MTAPLQLSMATASSKMEVVGAFRGVVCRDACEFRCCGVLNSDGLGGRCAVASIVRRSERTNHGVIACGISRNDFRCHLDVGAVAIVFSGRVFQHHVIRTFDSVCLWHTCENRSCRVLHSDGLCRCAAVAARVGRGEGPDHGVIALWHSRRWSRWTPSMDTSLQLSNADASAITISTEHSTV